MIVIVTIILAILVFSLIVIIHELGHMITAKKAGVKVEEFTIGFGPALFKKKIGETLYALRLIPLGGATIMQEEDGAQEPNKDAEPENIEKKDPSRSFSKAPLFSRFIILISGSVMNFLLGFVILSIIFLQMSKVPETKIEGFMPGFEQGENGTFQIGDQFTSVDGYKILIYDDISVALARNAGKPHDIELLRNGAKIELRDIPLEKKTYESNGQKGMYYGFTFSMKAASFSDKLNYAWLNSVNFVRMVWVSLGDLVTGRAGAKDLTGPLGISMAISETAKYSVFNMWYLVAFITINLSIINMLPLPALDGGRLMFLLVEFVKGKPVNPRRENLVHLIGLGLFVLLFVYVTFNDIVRQFFS